MSDKSGISWTDATWNPVTGCSKVSPGCAHCYAEKLSLQRGWSKKPWTPENAAENVVLHPDRLDQPLRWKEPRRIFVCSMADLFHENVPDEFIDRVFAVMVQTPQHTFQVLTKRPERMLAYMRMPSQRVPAIRRAGYELFGKAFAKGIARAWPLPNVWLGVSVENQRWADERIPLLLETPAAKRFVSCEPLLGPIDLSKKNGVNVSLGNIDCCFERREFGQCRCAFQGCLDWVIVGGESGKGFRPMQHEWVRSIKERCDAAGVPYFGKQAAGHRSGIKLPGELGVQEFPA